MSMTVAAPVMGMAAYFLVLKGAAGPHMFGCNAKSHALHFAVCLPASAVAAGICTPL